MTLTDKEKELATSSKREHLIKVLRALWVRGACVPEAVRLVDRFRAERDLKPIELERLVAG